MGQAHPTYPLSSLADALFAHSPDGAIIALLDGSILRANPAARAMLGWTEDDIRRLGRAGLLVPGAEADRLLAERDATSRVRGEVLLRTAGGGSLPVDLTCTIVRFPTGEPIEIVIFRDISEQRRCERELLESEARVRSQLAEIEALYETAPIGLCVFDDQLRWVRLNRQIAEINGVPLEAHLGRTPREIVPDIGAQAEAALRTILETGEPLDFEMRGTTKAQPGVMRCWNERWVPIKDPVGQIIGISVAAEEITERKRAEEALHDTVTKLRRAEHALRESDRRKTEFLAVLSHELRNLLAPVSHALFLLERAEPGTTAFERARQAIGRQIEHLTRVVGDLLDVSRVAHGKVTLELRRLDVREVVRRACDDARPSFDARGVALEADVAPEPLWVDADATRLAQVIANLLGNALKFTPTGGAVRVTLRPADDGAELRVRDTGAGIDPELLERIFEPFAQAGAAGSGGGLGIGLALVRSLVQLHGGTVHALSAGRDQGAELVVDLPLATAGEVDGDVPVSRAPPVDARRCDDRDPAPIA